MFDALGVKVQQVHLADAEALQKLKSGEIAATIVVTGKPAPVLANLKDTSGLEAARRAVRQGARGHLLPGDPDP